MAAPNAQRRSLLGVVLDAIVLPQSRAEASGCEGRPGRGDCLAFAAATALAPWGIFERRMDGGLAWRSKQLDCRACGACGPTRLLTQLPSDATARDERLAAWNEELRSLPALTALRAVGHEVVLARTSSPTAAFRPRGVTMRPPAVTARC